MSEHSKRRNASGAWNGLVRAVTFHRTELSNLLQALLVPESSYVARAVLIPVRSASSRRQQIENWMAHDAEADAIERANLFKITRRQAW